MTTNLHLAFLGLGQMGAPIASQLLKQGHTVTLWNRDRSKAEALARSNARIVNTPREAVADAAIVFTMLTDDAAHQAVLFGETSDGGISPAFAEREKHGGVSQGFLNALAPGAIHVTLSTISVGLARRITAAHEERGQHHVAAPVFGRPIVAQQGKLWIVTAGAKQLLDQVQPVLASISRGITVVAEEPWKAHALKLGGNLTITAMIQTLSEAFVYAESQGIDPALFHQAINNALFQSQLYENYGKTILNPPEHPGATVSLGIKDTALAREAAADAGIRIPLADYFADVLHRAKEAGFADQDWAIGQYRIAQSDAALTKKE